MNKFERLLQEEYLPSSGICNSLVQGVDNKEINIFETYFVLGVNLFLSAYWGYSVDNYDVRKKLHDRRFEKEVEKRITPLRQTILMLCNEIYKDEQLKKKSYDKKRKK